MKDFSIKASKLKSIIRSWRANGISAADTMKLMMLYLCTERFLDPETMVYPKKKFNQMRKENKYRSIPTMLELIEKSGSFQIIRSQSDGSIIAFASPALKKEKVADCQPHESVADSDKTVAHRDSDYLNSPSKDVINRSLNNDNEFNSNYRHRCIATPMPKLNKSLFNKRPLPEADRRVKDYFDDLAYDMPRFYQLLAPLINVLYERCDDNRLMVSKVLENYIDGRVAPVFAKRKGIENWKESQIDGWLQSLHQPKLAHIKADEAMRHYRSFR